MDQDAYYTVSEAEKVLGISGRRVRKLAQEGRIEGEQTPKGWNLFRHSVHSFRDERKSRESDKASREYPLANRELAERLELLQRELGRLEGRLELTEKAESTLRAERERLSDDLNRERERAGQREEEAQKARQETQRLAEELEAERSKGFWKRLFGR